MTHESAYYRICDNPEYFKFKISFGLLEKEKYAELSNCTTELERLYHRRVKDIAKRETRNYFSLFTYINEDPGLKSFQARLFE
nr:unnamed protein product [Spirometra erinaceieuropaei]